MRIIALNNKHNQADIYTPRELEVNTITIRPVFDYKISREMMMSKSMPSMGKLSNIELIGKAYYSNSEKHTKIWKRIMIHRLHISHICQSTSNYYKTQIFPSNIREVSSPCG